MNDLKKTADLKSLKVTMKSVTADGYKADWTFQSNVPMAQVAATPVKTAGSAADELGRMVEIYHDSGAGVALSAVQGARRVWDWKGGAGYERGENPTMTLLKKLAEVEGYHLVPFFEGNGHFRFQDLFQKDAEETRGTADHEASWDETWKEICLNEDGTVNVDQVKRELSDYSTLMHFYSTVLSHVTGGRVSKLFTWPSVINSVADDRVNELVEDETRDLQKQLEEGTPQ